MDIITIDGMVENDFRLSIEDMLRLDQVDEAVERLRGLLDTCAGEGKVLPARFLEVTSADLEIGGWHRLDDRLLDHGRSSFPITAIGVTLADARKLGGPRPSGGRLVPFIKTFYFTDDAYPFSEASRDDLLDGYSRDGFELQGDYRATDATLSVKGIDDLYGAIVELEGRLFDTPDPSEDEIRAGSIGSCFLAALIHQALRNTILEKGLPRPLCVFAACDGVYPFFDAPVIGSDECPVTKSETLDEEAESETYGEEPADEELAEEPAAEASLLTLGIRRERKAPVMVLDAQDLEEGIRSSEVAAAQRMGVADDNLQREALEFAQIVHPEGDLQLLDRPVDAEDAGIAAPEAWSDSRVEPIEHVGLPEQSPDADGSALLEPETRFESNDIPDPVGGIAPPEEQGDELLSAESIEDFTPPAVPAGHSLRARINSAQPQTVAGPVARFMTALGRFWQTILGR